MAQECGACGDSTWAREDISGRVGGLHITVRKQSDGRMPLELCKKCKLYHCPFCLPSVYKPKGEYANVFTHVEIHRLRALKHGEFCVHVCQLKCRGERHYHCPYCSRTILTRKHFERHMDKCAETQSLTCVKAEVPPSTPAQSVPAAGQRAIFLVTLAAPLQQTIMTGQNPAPPKPFVKLESTSGQPPVPTEPPAQPKSTSGQPPAPTEPPAQPKSTSGQPPAPTEPPAQPKSTSGQPPVPTEPPAQPKSTSGQPPVPTEPPAQPKSISGQIPAPPEPPVKPKSSSGQHPAPPEPSAQQKSTSGIPPASAEPPVSPKSTSDHPPGPPEPPAQPQSLAYKPVPPQPLVTPQSTSDNSPTLQKSTSGQCPSPPDQIVATAFQPADLPVSPVQPTTPAVHSADSPMKPSGQIHGTVRRKIKCPLCNLYLNPKNLRVHNRRKHLISERDITAKSHLKSQCIDSNNSVYAVAKAYKATAVPLHVIKQRLGSTNNMMCEEDRCKSISDFRKRSNLPESQCPHLRSVDFCSTRASRVDLKPELLEELSVDKRIGKDMAAKCLNYRDIASQNGAPLVALVDLGGNHCLYLSVFEPNMSQYSKLGRIFVTFTLKGKIWHCVCSRGRVPCLHRCLAKWFLFQTKKDLLYYSPMILSELTDDAPPETSTEIAPGKEPLKKQMALYIYNQKKLPNMFPGDIVQFEPETQFPKHLVPAETVCQVCQGNVFLTEPVLITNKARVITLTGMTEDNSTLSRKCPECQMVYRYQEWGEGLHNYNNHIILSLQLCMLLQNSIKIHAADGGVEVLERTVGVKSSCGMEVLQAYLHFEALTSHTCQSEVMMALHQKGVFNMAGIEIKGLPESFTGEVNAEDFWDSACLEIISSSLEARNPGYNSKLDDKLTKAAASAVSTSFSVAERKRLTKQRTDECHRAVARFLVKGLHPVSTVESPWFREMTEMLNPKYCLPSRDQLINTLIPSWFSAEKKCVIKELLHVSKAALTCDWWTSINRDQYRTVSLHFIMKGQMMHKVLRTNQVYDAQTDTAVAEQIAAVLKEFGVGGKVVAMTVDNAFSMDRDIKKLKFRKLRCFAQILNGAAQKVYTSNTMVRWASKIRAAVWGVKSSSAAQMVLQEKQKLLNLPQHSLVFDVQAHWNSLYLMVERFVEQFSAIQATTTDPRIKPSVEKKRLETLSDDDRWKAEEFIRTMKPLYTSTLCVSADKSPSCSQIFPILKKLEAHFEPGDEDSLFTATLKEKVWDDLSTCYRDADTWKFLQESSAMDPRFKNSIDSDEIWGRVKMAAVRAATVREVSNSEEHEDSDDEYSNESLLPKRPRLTALEELFEEEDRALKSSAAEDKTLSIPERVQREIQLYRKLPAIPTSQDALAWWWERRTTLALLSELSNSYLCVQASSTPRERVFSTAGDTISQERAHILPEKVNMQIFLQKNS